MRKHRILIAYLASMNLASCVYRVDIQQGNLITQKQVDQLKPGMTMNQVRYLMGTSLMQNPFQPKRFDYIHSLQKADQARHVQHLTMIFDNEERLSGLRGDFRPQPQSEAGLQPAEMSTVEVPPRKTEKGLFEWFGNVLKNLF